MNNKQTVLNWQQVRAIVDDLKKNADRYEKLRTLTPLQFSELYQSNLEFGIPFDELVDEIK
jgi:hypothetical protein